MFCFVLLNKFSIGQACRGQIEGASTQELKVTNWCWQMHLTCGLRVNIARTVSKHVGEKLSPICNVVVIFSLMADFQLSSCVPKVF